MHGKTLYMRTSRECNCWYWAARWLLIYIRCIGSVQSIVYVLWAATSYIICSSLLLTEEKLYKVEPRVGKSFFTLCPKATKKKRWQLLIETLTIRTLKCTFPNWEAHSKKSFLSVWRWSCGRLAAEDSQMKKKKKSGWILFTYFLYWNDLGPLEFWRNTHVFTYRCMHAQHEPSYVSSITSHHITSPHVACVRACVRAKRSRSILTFQKDIFQSEKIRNRGALIGGHPL